jgi:hypothetical protein
VEVKREIEAEKSSKRRRKSGLRFGNRTSMPQFLVWLAKSPQHPSPILNAVHPEACPKRALSSAHE